MCGVAGIIDLKATREIDRAALERMSAALAHRGPDGEGMFVAPGVGLAHRRLAVIDRKGGAQPFRTAHGRGVLNFNGEIYNYRALAAELAAKGVTLSTRSDTEVLAEGLALEGSPFIDRLLGMFAFAYWDATSGALTLCRDRLGEKPLYYAETDDGWLLFASEITALAKSGLVPVELNDAAVADYLFYGFAPGPDSIFSRIKSLPPASILSVTRGGAPKLSVYWRPPLEPDAGLTFDEATEQLRALLDAAVGGELTSDVPLGAFLSGGLDSSAIVAAMAQAGETVKTCAIGFEHAAHDERPHARIVADRYGVEHFEAVVSLDAAELIDAIARCYGEPFADPSALPTFVLAKMTRERVKVALSGDGGDEVFAGYRRYPFFVREERIRRTAPFGFRSAIFGAAGALYPKMDWAPRILRMKTTFQALGRSRPGAYAQAVAANVPDRIRALMSEDFKQSLGDYRFERAVEATMEDRDEPALLAAQRADFSVWLPARMLTKIDRASMAHGLEVRAPFLDHRLVEWACRLPIEFKLRKGRGKYVLKEAMRARLPSEIIDRDKQGFSPPIAQWLRDPAGPIARLERSERWRRSGYFNPKSVESMIRAHKRGSADCGQELWTLIMFDAFLETAKQFARF